MRKVACNIKCALQVSIPVLYSRAQSPSCSFPHFSERFVFRVSVVFFDIILSGFFDMSFSSLQILAAIFFAVGASSIFHFSVERFPLTLALFLVFILLFAASLFFDSSVSSSDPRHSPIFHTFTIASLQDANSLCTFVHLFNSNTFAAEDNERSHSSSNFYRSL